MSPKRLAEMKDLIAGGLPIITRVNGTDVLVGALEVTQMFSALKDAIAEIEELQKKDEAEQKAAGHLLDALENLR
jgi:hypothetical protein